MSDIQELERRVSQRLQGLLDSRERLSVRLPALQGKTSDSGNADVPGREGWVYVRVGSDETLATAFNNRTSHRNDLPVIVGYDPAQPELFQVLSVREVYPGSSASGGAIAPHHAQHEWGQGEDVVYIRMRQLTDFMVYPTDPPSMEVNVADGVYLIGSTAYSYAGGAVDLDGLQPATGMCWVLIALDVDGPYTVQGAAQAVVDFADIPAASAPTHWPLAAVLLRSNTTSVTDWPDAAMIVDLRLSSGRSPAGGGGYVDWENVAIVAKSGGSYNTIQAALDAVASGDVVYILPGMWGENLTVPMSGLIITGMMNQDQDSQVGVLVSGADNTGPVITVDYNCTMGQMQVIRVVSGGSGTFIGIDASGASRQHLTDMRIAMYGGSGTLAMIACKIGATSSYGSTLERCHVISDDIAASSGAALELVGSGTSWVKNCIIENTGGQVAVRITGNGTYIFEECNIDGKVVISSTATVYFRNCLITGDLSIAGSGATVYTRNCFVGGDISIGAGDTWTPVMTDQASSKTVTNAGAIIGTWFFANEGTYTDHFFGPVGNNQAAYSHLSPVGSVSGIDRASQRVFFTDYLADTANYERAELVAFDDGVDIAGVLRTIAGGAGTLHDLWLGVGGDKTKYVQLNSDGDIAVPAGAEVDGVDISAHVVDADAHHAHANKTELDLVTDGDHDVRTDNPHGVTATQAGASPTGHTHTHNGLLGLADDDHTQYLLADGSRALTGAWSPGQVVTLPNTGLHLLDTDASHDLIIVPGSNLATVDRTLTLVTGDADRTVTLSGNPTLADWFDQSVKIAASPTFVTAKLTGLTDGYIPYHIADATGLANSPIRTNGTNVGIGVTTAPATTLEVAGTSSGEILRLSYGADRTFFHYIGQAFHGTVDGSNRMQVFISTAAKAHIEILRLTGAGKVGIMTTTPDSRLDIADGALTMSEMTAPAAPAVNGVVVYAVDNGAGKTRLMALFATGVAQQISIQP